MSNRIAWNKALERWELTDRELIDYMRQGLQPYSKNTGYLYDCPQEFHIGYHIKMRISELDDQIGKLTTELLNSGIDPYLIYSDTDVSKLQDERSYHKKQLDKFIKEDPYCRSWEHFIFCRDEEKAKELISRLKDHVEFKLKDVEDFEKKHYFMHNGTESKIPDAVRKKLKDLKSLTVKSKPRPNQRHKIECRKLAGELWKKHPDMTIADMINHAKMIEVSKKSNGNLYTEKTVRNWIKDLCPDRSPGRRSRN
jgi:hypothetical protein